MPEDQLAFIHTRAEILTAVKEDRELEYVLCDESHTLIDLKSPQLNRATVLHGCDGDNKKLCRDAQCLGNKMNDLPKHKIYYIP